jgi:hypothetical protein
MLEGMATRVDRLRGRTPVLRTTPARRARFERVTFGLIVGAAILLLEAAGAHAVAAVALIAIPVVAVVAFPREL